MTGFLWAWLGSTRNSIEKGGYDKRYGMVPFLNVYFFIKVSDKPMWWFLLMFIPILNFVVFSLILLNNLSKIGEHSTKYLW